VWRGTPVSEWFESNRWYGPGLGPVGSGWLDSVSKGVGGVPLCPILFKVGPRVMVESQVVHAIVLRIKESTEFEIVPEVSAL
jgi:hypothetical protein